GVDNRGEVNATVADLLRRRANVHHLARRRAEGDHLAVCPAGTADLERTTVHELQPAATYRRNADTAQAGGCGDGNSSTATTAPEQTAECAARQPEELPERLVHADAGKLLE